MTQSLSKYSRYWPCILSRHWVRVSTSSGRNKNCCHSCLSVTEFPMTMRTWRPRTVEEDCWHWSFELETFWRHQNMSGGLLQCSGGLVVMQGGQISNLKSKEKYWKIRFSASSADWLTDSLPEADGVVPLERLGVKPLTGVRPRNPSLILTPSSSVRDFNIVLNVSCGGLNRNPQNCVKSKVLESSNMSTFYLRSW